ncbi:Asp23/Gls24 family envelope stress response protein [Rubrobacter aplysinae]|uniref:Asp23/Gls24 family envelope stress response protein n=1 Tax=Rubrobacter aplysinae TaxID=909625 RepID=UPI00069E0381|nr:Asp23/Gls24 family envelope stress response protein [Rubrobacter aplysinae]
MSEQAPRRSGQSQQSVQGQQSDRGQQGRQEGRDQGGNLDNPLRTERGDTTIQESVVSQVSGIAAQETEGIRMGGGGSQRASGVLGSVTGGSGKGRTQGVSVEVGREEAAVDLTLTLEYGRPAPQVADAVRRNVINRVEGLLGLRVTEVNVSVTGIFFPDEEQSEQGQQDQQGQQSQRSSSRVS